MTKADRTPRIRTPFANRRARRRGLAGAGLLTLALSGLVASGPARARPEPMPAGPDARIVTALDRALADPDAAVRRQALLALSRLGPPALPSLLGALAGKDPELRRLAASELGHFPAPAVLLPLSRAVADPDAAVRRQALLALSRLGPAAVPTLLQALRSTDPEVRRLAVGELGHLARPPRLPAPPRVTRPGPAGGKTDCTTTRQVWRSCVRRPG
jgi:HEAT repeat protein